MGKFWGLSLIFHLSILMLVLPAHSRSDAANEDLEVEEISAELAKKVEMPRIPLRSPQSIPPPKVVVVEPKEDLGEVLWVMATHPKGVQVAAVMNQDSPSRIETGMSLADAKLVEARVKMKKDNKNKGLPEASPHMLSDKKLAELCAGLTAPNPHTMDTVSNSKLSNFSVQSPLVLRVGQMESITNVQGEYVILVPASKGKSPEVELLKGVRKPYVLCGVKARKLEDVTSPVIFVGVKAPKLAKKNSQIRSIASQL